MENTVEQCPLCGTELSRVKFREIQSKLQDADRIKEGDISRAQAATRHLLEHQFKLEIEKQKQVAEKKARGEADQEIKKLAAR